MPRPGYQHRHPYYTAAAIQAAPQNNPRDSGCPKLGHVIAKARMSADLKQATLAKKIGVSRSRIAQWERGKRPVPRKMIAPLQDALAPELDNLEFTTHGHFAEFVRLT